MAVTSRRVFITAVVALLFTAQISHQAQKPKHELDIIGKTLLTDGQMKEVYICRFTFFGYVTGNVKFEWNKSANRINTNLENSTAPITRTSSDWVWTAEVNHTLSVTKECEEFQLICVASSLDLGINHAASITIEVKALPQISSLETTYWMCPGAKVKMVCMVPTRTGGIYLSIMLLKNGSKIDSVALEGGTGKLGISREITATALTEDYTCLVVCNEGGPAVSTFTRWTMNMLPCQPTIAGPTELAVGQTGNWTCTLMNLHTSYMKPVALEWVYENAAIQCQYSAKDPSGDLSVLKCPLVRRIAAEEAGTRFTLWCRSVWSVDVKDSANTRTTYHTVVVPHAATVGPPTKWRVFDTPLYSQYPRLQPMLEFKSPDKLGTGENNTLYLDSGPKPLTIRCRPFPEHPSKDDPLPAISKICGTLSRKTAKDTKSKKMASFCMERGAEGQPVLTTAPQFAQSWTATVDHTGSLAETAHVYFQLHADSASCNDEGAYECQIYYIIDTKRSPEAAVANTDNFVRQIEQVLMVKGEPGQMKPSGPLINTLAGTEVTLRCEGNVGPDHDGVKWHWEWRSLDLSSPSNMSFNSTWRTKRVAKNENRPGLSWHSNASPRRTSTKRTANIEGSGVDLDMRTLGNESPSNKLSRRRRTSVRTEAVSNRENIRDVISPNNMRNVPSLSDNDVAISPSNYNDQSSPSSTKKVISHNNIYDATSADNRNDHMLPSNAKKRRSDPSSDEEQRTTTISAEPATRDDHSKDHDKLTLDKFEPYTKSEATFGESDANSKVPCQRRQWSELTYIPRAEDGRKEFRCYITRDDVSFVDKAGYVVTQVMAKPSGMAAKPKTHDETWEYPRLLRIVLPIAMIALVSLIAGVVCYKQYKRTKEREQEDEKFKETEDMRLKKAQSAQNAQDVSRPANFTSLESQLRPAMQSIPTESMLETKQSPSRLMSSQTIAPAGLQNTLSELQTALSALCPTACANSNIQQTNIDGVRKRPQSASPASKRASLHSTSPTSDHMFNRKRSKSVSSSPTFRQQMQQLSQTPLINRGTIKRVSFSCKEENNQMPTINRKSQKQMPDTNREVDSVINNRVSHSADDSQKSGNVDEESKQKTSARTNITAGDSVSKSTPSQKSSGVEDATEQPSRKISGDVDPIKTSPRKTSGDVRIIKPPSGKKSGNAECTKPPLEKMPTDVGAVKTPPGKTTEEAGSIKTPSRKTSGDLGCIQTPSRNTTGDEGFTKTRSRKPSAEAEFIKPIFRRASVTKHDARSIKQSLNATSYWDIATKATTPSIYENASGSESRESSHTQRDAKRSSQTQGNAKGSCQTHRDAKGSSHTEGDAKGYRHTQRDAKGSSHTEGDAKGSSQTQRDAKGSSQTQRDTKGSSHTEGDAKGSSQTQQDAKGPSQTQRDTKGSSHTERDAKGSSHTQRDAKGSSHTGGDSGGSSQTQRDTKGSSHTEREAKGSSRTQRDSKESSHTEGDAKGSSQTQRDTKGSSHTERDAKRSSHTQRDAKGSSDTVGDAKGSSQTQRDTKGSSQTQRDTKGSSHTERDVKGSSHTQRDAEGSSHTEGDAKGFSHTQRDAKGFSHRDADAKGSSHRDADSKPPKARERYAKSCSPTEGDRKHQSSSKPFSHKDVGSNRSASPTTPKAVDTGSKSLSRGSREDNSKPKTSRTADTGSLVSSKDSVPGSRKPSSTVFVFNDKCRSREAAPKMGKRSSGEEEKLSAHNYRTGLLPSRQLSPLAHAATGISKVAGANYATKRLPTWLKSSRGRSESSKSDDNSSTGVGTNDSNVRCDSPVD